MKILLAEDDPFINQMLVDFLTGAGYHVTPAYSGTEALFHLQGNTFDLLLLDLMLPGKPGLEVLKELRMKSQLPVIVLTAVDTKDSTISLLRAGANDYLSKPFHNEELLARIEVQLRTVQKTGPEALHHKNVTLDLDQLLATVHGEPLSLSKREFAILRCLMENPQRVFTKNNLYQQVWGDEFYGDENTVNVHISKIRSKLAKADPDQEYIQTVWGIGFKMA